MLKAATFDLANHKSLLNAFSIYILFIFSINRHSEYVKYKNKVFLINSCSGVLFLTQLISNFAYLH